MQNKQGKKSQNEEIYNKQGRPKRTTNIGRVGGKTERDKKKNKANQAEKKNHDDHHARKRMPTESNMKRSVHDVVREKLFFRFFCVAQLAKIVT